MLVVMVSVGMMSLIWAVKNFGKTATDQAMDILKTPPEEHQYFKDLLAKEQ